MTVCVSASVGNWRHLFLWHHVSSFTEFPPLLTRPCLCSWMRTCGRPRPTDRRSGRAVSISTMDSTAARRLTNQSVSPLALLRGALRVQTTFAFKRFGWCVCKSGHDFSETASLSLSLSPSLTHSQRDGVGPAGSQFEIVANFVSASFIQFELQFCAFSVGKC